MWCSFFFQTFTSVVGFGLFHGLTFLPVVFSLIGPEPYDTSITESVLEQYTNITYSSEDVALNRRDNTTGVTINGYIRNSVPNSSSRVKINGYIKNGFPYSSNRLKINGYIKNGGSNSSSRVKINGYIKNGFSNSSSRLKINGYIKNGVPNSSSRVKINGYIRNGVPDSRSRVKINGYIKNDIPNSSSRLNEGFEDILELDSLPVSLTLRILAYAIYCDISQL